MAFIQKIKNAMIILASRKPIKSIDNQTIDYITETTGADRILVEDTLVSAYPHGLIGGFLANYYEMAFKGAAAFIATDAHSVRHRPNDLEKMLRTFPQDIDRELMNRMLKTNAQHVLNDEPVRPNRFIRLVKRRYY